MGQPRYIVFNYDDLTDESKEYLLKASKSSEKNITHIELKEGKTGYMFNRNPF
jgi:hypothetical protein